MPSGPRDLRNLKYLVVTLGCFRNEVESDLLRGGMDALGMTETTSLDEADVALVNTCGFIREACDEGIDTILELAELAAGCERHPPILLVGCMAQRYGTGLSAAMPEVAGVLGIDWGARLEEALTTVLEGGVFQEEPGPASGLQPYRDVDSRNGGTLYLRISDGCSNGCLFCSIPSIRGPFRSRGLEEILDEARRLVGGGPREVLLLAQDLTSYGRDTGEADLGTLLRALSGLDGVRRIRMLYLQPDGVNRRLIEEVASNEKVCNYFDVPFQHASARVLRSMGRTGNRERNLELLSGIRDAIPDATLRTTLMTGYPGETENDFEELLSFAAEAGFDWLGAFVFSREEGTPAARLPARVPLRTAVSRYNRLVELQEGVENSRQSAQVGRRLEVLVEGPSELDAYDLVGRSYREAPVVDGIIHLKGRSRPGRFVQVTVTGLEGLDLAGEIEPDSG